MALRLKPVGEQVVVLTGASSGIGLATALAQALSPSLGAILIEWSGSGAALGLLAGMATLNITLVGFLWTVSRPAMRT